MTPLICSFKSLEGVAMCSARFRTTFESVGAKPNESLDTSATRSGGPSGKPYVLEFRFHTPRLITSTTTRPRSAYLTEAVQPWRRATITANQTKNGSAYAYTVPLVRTPRPTAALKRNH